METGKAKIKLLDSLNITGRGLVFIVEFLEGDFMIGDYVKFEIENKPYCLKIKSLEMINYRPNFVFNPHISGVLFEMSKTESQELYKNPLLKDMIAEIM